MTKSSSGETLVAAIEAAASPRHVHVSWVVKDAHESTPGGDGPGRNAGLTLREAEMLSLIVQGFGNQEIADHAHLSLNTVKTYIRTAYRKIQARSRAQAVIWALRNGFDLAPLRWMEPSDDQYDAPGERSQRPAGSEGMRASVG